MAKQKDKFAWARESLERGLQVFPLTWTTEEGCSCGTDNCAHDRSRHGKHPIPGSSGFKDATGDLDKATELWMEYPEGNIGVYPGRNHVIIDVDRKNKDEDGNIIDGLESLADHMEMEPQEVLELTFTVKTTTGGYHLYFESENSYPNSVNIIPGIDVRGVNGYVLGPGSEIHGKFYETINDVEIAELPDEIESLLSKQREKHQGSDKSLFEWDAPDNIKRVRDLLKVRKPAKEGYGGNHHTFCTALLARDHAVSMEALVDIVMEPGGWNSRCEPPWGYDELTGPAGPFRNAYAYGKNKPGIKGIDDDMLVESVMANLTPEEQNQIQDYAEIEAKRDKQKQGRKELIRQAMFFGGDFISRNHKYDMIIRDWVPAEGLTCLLGARSSGKSTILTDMTMRIVMDLDFYTYEIDKGWSVCYIVGEDAAGLGARQKAWCIQHGFDPMQDIPHNRLITLEMPLNLMDPEEVDDFMSVLRAEAQLTEKVIFVIDTWQRMTSSAESQSNEHDINMAITNLEAMCRDFGGPAIGAFHPPKGNEDTIAGTGITENISSSILQVTKVGGKESKVRELRSTRIKGAPEGSSIIFTGEQVGIGGVDNFGRENTSFIFRQTGGVGMKSDATQITVNDMVAQTLYNLLTVPYDMPKMKPDAGTRELMLPKAMNVLYRFKEENSPDTAANMSARDEILKPLLDAESVDILYHDERKAAKEPDRASEFARLAYDLFNNDTKSYSISEKKELYVEDRPSKSGKMFTYLGYRTKDQEPEVDYDL